MPEGRRTQVRVVGQRARVRAVPHNGPKCRLEADLHVQRVGALEVDVDEDISDDEISGQGESVFVEGVGSITLWYKNKTTYMITWRWAAKVRVRAL